MKKFMLMTTTAIVAGFLTASPVIAQETSMYKDLKNAITEWFSPQPDQTEEVNAYLDQVTIAVPPITGDNLQDIQPAAGDAWGDEPATLDQVMNDEDSMINTDYAYEGSVAAFGDNQPTAEDMANIMPAAGDAEEINDEAVIVAEDDATEINDEAIIVADEVEINIDKAAEANLEETEKALEEFAEETQENTDDAVLTTETTTTTMELDEVTSDITTDTDMTEDAMTTIETSVGSPATTETTTQVENMGQVEADPSVETDIVK
jgi:hypothetical protein